MKITEPLKGVASVKQKGSIREIEKYHVDLYRAFLSFIQSQSRRRCPASGVCDSLMTKPRQDTATHSGEIAFTPQLAA
jgi:hypothetical protein